jgi:hypothetical protein
MPRHTRGVPRATSRRPEMINEALEAMTELGKEGLR